MLGVKLGDSGLMFTVIVPSSPDAGPSSVAPEGSGIES